MPPRCRLGARWTSYFPGPTALRPITAALLLLILATGCHSASEVTAGPSAVKCAVKVQAETTGFSASGGSGSVHISASRECTWTAQADAGWLTLGGTASGQGDATLAFVVAANATTTARDAHITVKDQRVDISQQGACAVHVSSNHESVGPDGGTRTVEVTATDAQCTWTAVSNTSWITIASGATGSGNGAVSFHVAATSGPARSGEVTVGGQVVRVSQSTHCSISVAPSTTAVPASGGTGTLRVDAAAGCAWSAVSAADWITITSGATGSGGGEVRFTVRADSGSGRSGVIHVGDQDVTVTQGATCSLSISPSALSVGAEASTAHVDVSAADTCEWTAESRSEWVTVTSRSRGTGAGRVTLGIAANSGPERTGSVSVAGHTVPVTQSGGCLYHVSPSAVTLPGLGGGSTVSISTDSACAWTAKPSDSWIDVSNRSGAGGADLRISAATNLGESRKGSVTLGGHRISVSQPSSCSYVLSPPSADFPADGGAGTVLVITTGTCSWTASTDASWIRITVGATGDGNGLVQFKVDRGTGQARIAHLTIAEKDFAVRQAAP